MVDFLVGGASAGESLRLKLQTPLFVSDALLEAARTQLAAELATAEQVHCKVALKLCFWLPACFACHLQIAIMGCLVHCVPQDCTATVSHRAVAPAGCGCSALGAGAADSLSEVDGGGRCRAACRVPAAGFHRCASRRMASG